MQLIESFFFQQSIDKVIKLWKITERCRRFQNLNTVTDEGLLRDHEHITDLKVPTMVKDDLSIEAMPRRVFSNAHTYHINSISVNSDDCTYLSADDLRINIWHLEKTEQSFSILFICCILPVMEFVCRYACNYNWVFVGRLPALGSMSEETHLKDTVYLSPKINK